MYYHLFQLRGQPLVIAGLGADGLEFVKNYIAEHPNPSEDELLNTLEKLKELQKR